MAGGIWTATDKPVLPGLYLNFRSAGISSIQAGERGTVAMPVRAIWGDISKIYTITSEKELKDAFTDDTTSGTAYKLGRLALMGGAKKVLMKRITDGTDAKASVTLKDTSTEPVNVLKLEAKYTGTYGNKFKVSVSTNAINSQAKDLKILIDNVLVKTFTVSGDIDAIVSAINSDTENLWIVASKLADGNGTLANVTSAAFNGGSDGSAPAVSNYTDAFVDFEKEQFNIFVLDGITDSSLQASLKSWIERLREEGYGVMAVIGGSATDDKSSDAVTKAIQRGASMNYEGIVNVGVGAYLDGVEYSSSDVACWVAGLIAGQTLAQSTTYAVAPFSDVNRRWTRSEMEESVNKGVFLLFWDGEKVKVLRGINTLISLREGQNEAWKKVRAIRVMDSINNDLVKTAEDNYIGKVNNTSAGRNALVMACREYMRTLALGGVIEADGWDVKLDPDYYNDEVSIPADEVYIRWEARLTDVMEKIFGTFIVK